MTGDTKATRHMGHIKFSSTGSSYSRVRKSTTGEEEDDDEEDKEDKEDKGASGRTNGRNASVVVFVTSPSSGVLGGGIVCEL